MVRISKLFVVISIFVFSEYASAVAPKSDIKERPQSTTVISHAPQSSLDETYNSTDVPLAREIPDVGEVTSELVVADNYDVGDINVFVDITHTYDRDIIIILESPSGTQDTLFNRRGGSGDDITGCTFDDQAELPIAAGTAPFAGSWRPEHPLSICDGENISGTWLLIVSDHEAADEGTLNSWGIEVAQATGNLGRLYIIVTDIDSGDPIPGAQIELVQPDLNFCADQLGEAIIENVPAGPLTINITHQLYQDWTQTSQLDSGELELIDATMTPRDITFLDVSSTGAAVPIHDLDSSFSEINVTQSLTLYDVNCEINISHTWDSDLDIWLEGPSGIRVLLVSGAGPGEENFVDCVFDDESCQSIFEGTAPFTGVWRPMEFLSAFQGLNSVGTWTLGVYDAVAQDTGLINEWTLHLSSETGVSIDDAPPSIAKNFVLHGAYPNPFNATTTFSFDLATASNVELKLYDLLGREAAVLQQGLMNAGHQEIRFEASGLASGIYLAALKAGEAASVNKIVLIK